MANDKAKPGADLKANDALKSIMESFAAIDKRQEQVTEGLGKVAAAVEGNTKSLDMVASTLTSNSAKTNEVLDRVALGLSSMGKRDEALIAAQNQLGSKLDGFVNEVRAARPESIDEDRLAEGVGNQVAAALRANAWSGRQLFGSALAGLLAVALVMFLVLKLSGIGSAGTEGLAKSKEEQEKIVKAAAEKAVEEANKSRPATVATSFPSLAPIITSIQGQSVHLTVLTSATNGMTTAVNGQTKAINDLVGKLNGMKSPPTADEIAEAIEKRRMAAASGASPSAMAPASPAPGSSAAPVAPSDPAAPSAAPSVPPSGGSDFASSIGSELRNRGADPATAAKLANEAAMAKHLGKSYKHKPETSETTTPDGWKVKATGPGLELMPPCKEKSESDSGSRSSRGCRSKAASRGESSGYRNRGSYHAESDASSSSGSRFGRKKVVATFPTGGSAAVSVGVTHFDSDNPAMPRDGGMSINPILDFRNGGKDGAQGATGAAGAPGRDGIDAGTGGGGRGDNNGGGNAAGGRGSNNGG